MMQSISRREKLKLWFFTLFYHTSFSYEYTMDTITEPLFWFIDHFTQFLGRVFVFVVVFLVTLVVIIAHMLGLPFWWNKSPAFTICLIVVGYWILVNLTFNFYQVAVISPGLPIDPVILQSCCVTICKKCINPKPPRTHHCSICNRCYLNMDHHCPWVNNCVGHFNRRYFFMCMVYIVTGCIYIMLFGVELAFREVILDEDVLPVTKGLEETAIISGPLNDPKKGSLMLNAVMDSVRKESPPFSSYPDDDAEPTEKACLLFHIIISKRALKITIYFAGLLCIGASLALGGLTLWHGKLITEGETSIEYHSNRAERKRQKGNFKNPYDLGIRRNWELLLGLEKGKITFGRHILLPSTHKPFGDGYDWSHITAHTIHNS